MTEKPQSPSTADAVANLRGQRAAVVLFSTYPHDPRPRRAAEALQAAGMHTEVICLCLDETEPRRDEINGVTVLRIPMKRRRGGKLSYLFQYSAFILISAVILAVRTLHRRYRIVHVHNMPDVLVISGLVPKLFGARIVLDLHDPMPELMMTIYQAKRESRFVRFLQVLERRSIAFADRVLTVNEACKKIFGARSCSPDKVEVIMNSPDEKIFGGKAGGIGGSAPRDPARKFVVMCHGSIVERHGHDIAVDAIARLRITIPNIELRIYGHKTRFLDKVMADVASRKLDQHVVYCGGMGLDGIVKAIDQCDVGIIPNRRSIFTELNTPTRIFEYLARNVPVIAPRAPGIQDYFKENEILYFELGNSESLAAQIEYVFKNPGKVPEVIKRGQMIYHCHQWEAEKSRLLAIMNDLAAPKKHRSTAVTAEPIHRPAK